MKISFSPSKQTKYSCQIGFRYHIYNGADL